MQNIQIAKCKTYGTYNSYDCTGEFSIIIFSLFLQTISTAQKLSIGEKGLLK